jgi:hypothetical protein
VFGQGPFSEKMGRSCQHTGPNIADMHRRIKLTYGVCAGASKFNGGLLIPRGSDGTTAFTEEINVAESPAAFFMSSYLLLLLLVVSR